MNGPAESWSGIPWRRQEKINQTSPHATEMNQVDPEEVDQDEIFIMNNFEYDHKIIKVETTRGGTMSCLIGIAAHKSIE
jgi:hypothetical protein